MERFIVRYRGAGPTPADVFDRIRALDNASVLESSERMLLVEAPEGPLRSVLGASGDWLIAPVQDYELPEQPPGLAD